MYTIHVCSPGGKKLGKEKKINKKNMKRCSYRLGANVEEYIEHEEEMKKMKNAEWHEQGSAR